MCGLGVQMDKLILTLVSLSVCLYVLYDMNKWSNND